MVQTLSAADFLPRQATLKALRHAADGCQGCPLYKNATQTVFGEGAARASLLIVGEQPGDQEDRAGEPFVGPAGKLLHQILDEAGITKNDIYVTNAVKHFKWKPKGERRLHAKPSSREVDACHPWLAAEIELVNPRLIFCLGATAAQSLLGKDFRITRDRGRIFDQAEGPAMLATYHPSAILRAPREDRERMRSILLSDVRKAARFLVEHRK